jgi:hypothetical protein
MYDLAVDGVNGFLARRPGLQRFMRRQPLAGLVDGTTTVFLLPMYPCKLDLSIYLETTPVTSNEYVFYADTGTVMFYTAPTSQPVADYTAIGLTTAQIVLYLWAGFDLMEALWSRQYALSSSDTAYAMASPSDSHIYICQGPAGVGSTPTDPVVGTQTFSTSRIQRAWLERCAEFAYLDSMVSEAALSDVNVRERVGGVAISTDHRSANILRARDAMWREVIASMYAALDEQYPDGRHYGGAVGQLHTDYYATHWNWQSNNGILAPTELKLE